MRRMKTANPTGILLAAIAAAVVAFCVPDIVKADEPAAGDPGPYDQRAREVTAHIQRTFWNSDTGLYARSVTDRRPDFVWTNSVMFSALVAASRHEPATYRPVMQKFFTALDVYWDASDTPPGYEPSPTRGRGHDKYYDDNAWLAITFLEAYELTHDQRYLTRAAGTLKFVLSGWDDELGGGIWWHETHKDGTKNTCVNAPAAVACQRLAKFRDQAAARELVDQSQKLVDWTARNLQADDGLFFDRKVVASGDVKRGKLTYNSGLMIRALLGLYRITGNKHELDEARRIAKACDALFDKQTGAYRDQIKRAHLLVEADLELYRATKDEELLDRAKRSGDYYYQTWKTKPPDDLMTNAAIARVLWLLADTETAAGQAFWAAADKTLRN